MQIADFEITRDYVNEPCMSLPNTGNTCLPHFHRQLELLYITKGSNYVTINSKQRLLSENQMSIADSFDIHGYKNVGDSLSIVLIIPYERLQKFIAYKKETTLSDNFILDEEIALKFLPIMNLLKEYWNCKNSLILDGLFDSLLGLILQYIPLVKSETRSNFEIIHKILFYLEEHFHENLSLAKIANDFGYSKYYFSKLFNTHLHCHFNDYVNMLRVRHAVKLIHTRKINMLDAALDAGFSSMPTFYRSFKNIYNMNPSEFFKDIKK